MNFDKNMVIALETSPEEYLSFLINYLKSHKYIKTNNVAMDFITEKFGIYYALNSLCYGFRKQIIMKFAHLVGKAKKFGLLVNYGQKTYTKTRKRPSLDSFKELKQN